MTRHSDLQEAGRIPHVTIDAQLPTSQEKECLQAIGERAPVNVTGERDNPEQALANLLEALDGLGLITDSTTAT